MPSYPSHHSYLWRPLAAMSAREESRYPRTTPLGGGAFASSATLTTAVASSPLAVATTTTEDSNDVWHEIVFRTDSNSIYWGYNESVEEALLNATTESVVFVNRTQVAGSAEDADQTWQVVTMVATAIVLGVLILATVIEDAWLKLFLRNCNDSLESVKENIDSFYTMRSHDPHFKDRDPMDPGIQEALKSGFVVATINPLQMDNNYLLIFRGSVSKREHSYGGNYGKVVTMYSDMLLLEAATREISGCHAISDMENCSKDQYLLGLSFWPNFTRYVETSFPLTVNYLIGINAPNVITWISKVYRACLSKFVMSKASMFKKTETEKLHEYIPKKYLPKDYGGENATIQECIDHWKQKIESYREWFLEDDKYRNEESKREKKLNTSNLLFNMDGSFRQMTID